MSTRSRSRSRARRHHRRHPDTVASSSASSQVVLTSSAWFTTPPPAQPDMLVKPIHDDVGPVGTLQPFPTSDVTDAIMDFINQVKPNDLMQVQPLYAMKWDEVGRVLLPPQPAIEAYMPLDMRVTRWELYQELCHVPVMAGGKVVHTIILPWHLSMDNAKHRVDECAPHHRNWLLKAASPDIWLVHQLISPESVKLRLYELDRIRDMERGGMRATPKMPLRVHMKHSGNSTIALHAKVKTQKVMLHW